MGAPLWPDAGYHLKQNEMPMHKYISKFANLMEHAYGLLPIAQGSSNPITSNDSPDSETSLLLSRF